MKKNWVYGVTLIGLLVALVVGCRAKPAPTPVPTLAPVATPAPARAAPGPATEDVAWTRVVDAAQKEGELVIYASSTFAGPVARALSQAFKEKYGIRVEILVGSGRANNERVQVEQKLKKPIADVMQAGLSSLVEVMNAGFTQSVWRELPALRDKSVFIVDPVYSPDGSVLSFVTSAFSPLINTNLVKPDELTSYHDFLAPKWKGRIIIEEPRGGGGTGFAWWAGMRYFKVLPDDFWSQLAKQMVFFGGGSTPMYGFVARGEYAFSPSSSDTSVAPLIAEGAPLKMVEMKEGTYVQTLNIGALTNAAHPNASKLFINWLFTQEGQTVYAKSSNSPTIRKDVSDFSIPGIIGKPKITLFRDWQATEAFNSYNKDRIPEKLFGEK